MKRLINSMLSAVGVQVVRTGTIADFHALQADFRALQRMHHDAGACVRQPGGNTIAPSVAWESMVAEFHRMADLDRLRAITEQQMAWLTEVAGSVPLKEALDLGFGCSFSAVAMVRGGCSFTCVNNEAPRVPGGVLALDDSYYGGICSVVNWVMSNLGHIWKPHHILGNTISWKRTDVDGNDAKTGLAHRTHAGPPIGFEIATENADEFILYPGPNQGFELWKPQAHVAQP